MELLTAVQIAGALLALSASPAPATAETLTLRVEERLRSVGDLQARFVQTYRSGILGREIVEKGTLAIKRPGRMLWEYREPERKTFVSDGKRFFFYVPADRQVVVRDQAGDKRAPALLLAGRGDILSQFETSIESSAPPLRRLRLTPRKPDPDMDRAYLDVDDAGRIHGIEILDAQGNRSQFRFEAIRENVGLADELFRFEIPRGVEVISG